MRRLLPLLLLLSLWAHGQAPINYTPNLHLAQPPNGYPNWDTIINQNWSIIDTSVASIQHQYQGTWVSTVTYALGQTVTDSSGKFYISSIGFNLNNVPATSPGSWTLIPLAGGSGGGGVQPSATPLPLCYYASAGSTCSPTPAASFDTTRSMLLGKITNGIFPVVAYGAVADGVLAPVAIGSTATYSGTDNTVAFQTAINAACAAGGGEVDIPGGVYNVATTPGAPRQSGSSYTSTYTNIAAIIIPCSNLTLKGAGINSTFISVWMHNGSVYQRITDACPANPDFTPANPAFTFPRTWRGSGIYIAAQDVPGAVTSNVQIRDLTIVGNSVINGNNVNPVRQDTTVPLPFYSQCNAWDTSSKGIYLQNDDFGPNPTNGAFYNGCINCKFSNILVDHVRVTNFLGELIYSGNFTTITVSNDELAQSNGDGVSVGGGLTEINNYIHDLWANGNENSIYGPQTYQGNQFYNIQLDGVTPLNQTIPASAQYPTYPQIVIANNVFYKNARSAIHPFSPIHVQVTGNQIVDSGWALLFTAPISILGQFTPQPVSWTPPAPTATTPTVGSGGSINAGSYFVAESWSVPATYATAQSAVSACVTVPVASNGSTITIPAPSSPPAITQGWYAFIGTSCATISLFLQGGTTVPNANGTPLTVSTLATSGNIASSAGVVYLPSIGDVDVTDNMITADQASYVSGIQITRLGAGLNAIGLNGLANHGNHINITLANASTVVSPPSNPPVVTAVAGPLYTYPLQPVIPAGTYYVEYSWITPECQTAPSPQASITIGSSQQINVTPNPLDTPPANVFGYYVLMSTTSGSGFTIQTNNGSSLTIPANTYTQQYTLVAGSAPSTGSACNGTSIAQATSYGFNTTNAIGYTEYSNVGNAVATGATELQTYIGGATPALTTATTIASYRPSHPRWATASVNYQVINAPTNVVVQLVWVDYANAQHFLTMENVTAQPVGLYQLDPVDVPVGAAQASILTVTAGTAGNLLVNGQITDKGVN